MENIEPIELLNKIQNQYGLQQDFSLGKQENEKLLPIKKVFNFMSAIEKETIVFFQHEFYKTIQNIEKKVGYQLFGNS